MNVDVIHGRSLVLVLITSFISTEGVRFHRSNLASFEWSDSISSPTEDDGSVLILVWNSFDLLRWREIFFLSNTVYQNATEMVEESLLIAFSSQCRLSHTKLQLVSSPFERKTWRFSSTLSLFDLLRKTLWESLQSLAIAHWTSLSSHPDRGWRLHIYYRSVFIVSFITIQWIVSSKWWVEESRIPISFYDSSSWERRTVRTIVKIDLSATEFLLYSHWCRCIGPCASSDSID